MEYINNDTSLLQDYDLQMKVVDTASNSGSAMRDLIYILADDDPVVGLIGAPNSHVSMALAETTKWWNLIQIACSNYNPDLSNTEAFPLYFRTITPITAFNPALLALIQYYRWTRVAILYHHKDYETLVGSHELQAMLTDVNITVVVNEAFIDDPSEQIQKIKELDIRIIIGYFYSPEARRAFCEMHRLGMKSPKYVLLSIQTNDEWWQIDDGLTCSPEDLLNASEGAIFFVFYFERGNNTINVDVDDFGERYARLATALGFPESLFAYHQFDAVYALALALNKSIDSLAVIGKNLSSFSYDVQTADIFYASLRDTRFMGISGVIQFDENGDRIGQVLFRQVQSDGQVEIFGVYTLSEDLFELDNGWTSVSDAPRDRINHVTVIIKTSPVVIDLAIILASCGIIFSILVMIFNIYNRKKRVIKMSSPNINNLICVGGGMAYASVILHGLGNNADSVKTHDALCKISPWVFSLGFTIGFGALFAKTWRVHRIFTSKTTKRINILDWNLFLFVGILVFIDVIILTVWTTVDPVTTNTVSMVTRVDEEQDALIFPVLRKCYSENEVIWLGLSCGYKGIILLFGVFLAWETRKVYLIALLAYSNVTNYTSRSKVVTCIGACSASV
uniref:Gamma-aminobutyric acid type B receptor subunit 1-like n=1 Tax=Saccoglossus kowalevskii TaxID=10224 RepID=A0ABM0LVV0_SACKO|nr:PREDICTED: gamma-aminobutyric acid type B receptor subunit 1-like [Saccoglossus kowalevskii]